MNPFRKHFWVHCWSKWSEPYEKSGLRYQSRECKVCGKIEARLIEYHPLYFLDGECDK